MNDIFKKLSSTRSMILFVITLVLAGVTFTCLGSFLFGKLPDAQSSQVYNILKDLLTFLTAAFTTIMGHYLGRSDDAAAASKKDDKKDDPK